jgi:hypothetical protein
MESIVTPGSGHLKLTGSHGEVCPELACLYYPRLKYRIFLGYQGECGMRIAGSRCTHMILGL